MKRCLLALPVDGRPAVRAQVQQLLAIAGWELRCPEVSALGHFREPADRDALAAWLRLHAADADGLVLSLDMLIYGGLVPSRFTPDPLDTLRSRLALLHELKAAHPGLPLFAMLATMRISDNDVADEEKPYWAEHGRRLWAWSYHSDRAAVLAATVGGGGEEAARSAAAAATAESAIPAAVRADYKATRERNFAVALDVLGLVQQGTIDRLVLPQDDTALYGFNIAERRSLAAEVARRGLASRVAIYAGADEVLHTLAARLVAQLEGRPALRVHTVCSNPEHVAQLTALYEDRPLLDAVAAQVAAVGAVASPDETSADVLLAVHSQGTAQGDWAMRRALREPHPLDPAWLAGVRRWQQAGKPVLLADLAYANGGDPALFAQLGTLPSAYAGWNTASNSLGSLLATAVLAQGRWHRAEARQALELRLLEDLVYQAQLRQKLRGQIDETLATAADLLAAARAVVVPAANAWATEHGLVCRVADVALPWGRTFEIDLQLERAV